jgi:hypothetical protein
MHRGRDPANLYSRESAAQVKVKFQARKNTSITNVFVEIQHMELVVFR